MSDEISQSLGLAPLEGEIIQPKTISKPIPRDIDNDYQYARENFYNVIEKGTQALEDMLDVAKASEHPRAYEVVSTIMKTLVDANKDLVAMSDKKSKEDGPKEDEKSVTNNLFVGSTAELQQILKDLKTNE